ncbi:F0F1 ATP synthase subunit delta [Edaphobacter modestus]|uniref:F-type H+-transporting ATPase subunit delta n=1 Tax=Edaphobacter modestus TaxID=388466 RepID=A0A4Q7YSI1_9BACT|nr:F0F1 ATP synthase subunit delta [Edaphobacter modestus]RZU40752.1 F-type H+-transporting ATPase subunit delta [Edaphobacter modestus]
MTKKQSAREAKQMFRLCVVNGVLDEARVRQVLQAVLQSRRRGYLLLLEDFQRLVKLDHDQHMAKVESAVLMPADLQANVRSGLTSAYGSGITIAFSVNPALIGGMRIQVGSDVYDGSVQSGLDALRRSFGIEGTNGRNTEIVSP